MHGSMPVFKNKYILLWNICYTQSIFGTKQLRLKINRTNLFNHCGTQSAVYSSGGIAGDISYKLPGLREFEFGGFFASIDLYWECLKCGNDSVKQFDSLVLVPQRFQCWCTGLTVVRCQTPIKDLSHSLLQMDREKNEFMTWEKDWEGSLTKHHHGQNRLESDIFIEFMANKIRER